jgi:hypothetical protein
MTTAYTYCSVAIPMALTTSLWMPRATRHPFLTSAALGISIHVVGRGQEEIDILRRFTHCLLSALEFGCNILMRAHAGASTLEAVLTS